MPGAAKHLISVLVAAIVGSASAQSINVSIALVTTGPVPAPQDLPLPYTLNCTATSTPGPPNVTWITPPAGTVGAQTTSGSASSRTLTLPSPVQLSYAGLYVCNASANGVTRTTSYAFNVSVTTSTLPTLTITSTPPSPNYQGSLLTLTCSFGITSTNLIATSVQWVGPTRQPLVPGGRVTIVTYNSSSPGGSTLYTSNVTISSLSRNDGGTYICTPAIGLKVPMPYVLDSTNEMRSSIVTINDLPLNVTVSPTNIRSSSNSSFRINCTATKPPSVLLPFVFSWFWRDTYTGSVLTFNSSGVATIGGSTFFIAQPPGVTNSTPTVTSTLTVSQPLPGTYIYRCDVMISVPIDGQVNQTAFGFVSIPGSPNQPTNVMAKYISMDTATIQWTVPFVAYTRETYVVHYGSAPDNLNRSSMVVNGSAYLNVTGEQFGVNLTGLVPYSQYYYTIELSNTEGTTTTPLMNLPFFPLSSPASSPAVSSPAPTSNSSSPLPSASNNALAALVVVPIVAIVIMAAIIVVFLRKRHHISNDNSAQPGQDKGAEEEHDPKGVEPHSTPGSPCKEGSRLDYKEGSRLDYKEGSRQDTAGPTGAQPTTQRTPDKIGMTKVQPSTQPILLKDLNEMMNSMKGPKAWDSLWKSLSSGTSVESAHAKTTSHSGNKLPNGNAIKGYDGSPNAYIATQAPLQNTVEDFWRMVWENKCRVIVVLYGLNEKIAQFWPDVVGQHQTYNQVQVSVVSAPKHTNGAGVYELTLTDKQKFVTVMLYHIGSKEDNYSGWREHERPNNEPQFSPFCNEVQEKGHETPIVVMCNDGVGRTGTFITILAMLEMAKREKKVDIIQFIKSSRTQCPTFIRCTEHLRLCYETVNSWYDNLNSTQL